MYVIARTATLNPEISGQTLYLTDIGFWTLQLEYARKFKTEAEALAASTGTVSKCRIEKAED